MIFAQESDTGVGDSNAFALDTTDTGTGGDSGVGDSNAFALDTTDTGTGGDSGVGDSNAFALDTTDTGTGGDSGVGDSNAFALDTTDTGTGGDSGVGDSNAFALDTTDTGTGGDSGVGDSNAFALDTTDTGTGGDSGVGDSNAFALDTTDTGTGGDSGVGDSNTFALDTTSTGTGGDTGTGDSNTFALDTTDTGTGGDSGVGDSNAFALNTTDGNTTEGYLENIKVSGGDFASPFYEFNDSHGSPLALDTKVFFRGSTYVFQDAGVSASHPFMIGQSWGDTNSSLVTGGPLNGSGGQVSLSIPMDFNGSLYYFCTNHTSMIAPLIIGDEGHPVFDLNASALLALTGQNLTSGNYAVVEQNESKVDLEPVVQDANGTWFPTQASDYVNLVPNRFALFDDLKQWFDDRNLEPVGFLHINDHGTFTDGNGDSSIPTANLQLWLDGLDIDGDNSLANNPTVGTKIASWKDKSLNRYHASQALSDEQPTVSENGGLSFNGIRNHLTLGSNYIFSENDGMTIFASFSTDANNSKTNPVYAFGKQGETGIFLSANSEQSFLSTPTLHGGYTSYGEIEYSENQIISFRIKFSNNQVVRINGSIIKDNNITLTTLDASVISASSNRVLNDGPVTIGGQSKTSYETERFFSGIIREILVYDRALPEAEILQIESYLSEKWHNASGIDSNQTLTPLNDSNFASAIALWFDAEENATRLYGHISDWNVSAVTDMTDGFKNRSSFNEDISGWDTSSVVSMQGLFFMASAFNQPIGDWDLSSVTNMQNMFFGASAFNQPIGNWDVSKVSKMGGALRQAAAFNQPIGDWNTSSVTDMMLLFYSATSFNQPIGNWDTSAVTNMNGVFFNATKFNQDISNWDTSIVSNMFSMFKSTSSFDQNIADWNVSSVTNMTGMFDSANGLSNLTKGSIHASFYTNQNWPYDWSMYVTTNNPPTDFNATSSLAFNENLPVGSVITEFNATDPDGDSLAYSLVDGNGSTHNQLFTLDTNGTLKTATSFDYETNATSYSIRVQAKDEHNASIQKEFSVTLLDVHENTAPHFQSDGNLTILENQTFVYEFNASDLDANTTLSYSILSGEDAGKFTLNSTTGGLSFATAPDFESPEDNNSDNIYQLSIQVSDGEANATLNVSVTVEDLSYEPSKPNVVVQSAAELEMIWVEPGTFTMGSPTTESGRGTDETQHEVTLTRGFYLSKFEVTQAQYQAVMEGNPDGLSATPSQIAGANRPVESVSWSDLQIFIQRLNASEQAAGRLAEGESFGLPTEAEWEYACRAGSTTTYSWGDSFTTSNANYTGANINSTSNVGSFQANAWGFFDMHGNVWEYCADWYGNYTNGSVEDPTGPTTGTNRVKRGGSYVKSASFMRSALRSSEGVNKRLGGIGFRLAFYPADTANEPEEPESDTGFGDSNGFSLDTTDSGTGGDTGYGDSNGFTLDTTDSGTGGDTGVGDSNGFTLDTTDSGTGGDTGHGDSNGFTLDTTDSGSGGDTGHGDSNGFALDTTDSGTGGDTGFGDSNGFTLDTTDSGTGGDTGHGDSNGFTLDTTDSGTGGDTGHGDSNGFALDTTDSGTGGDTGHGDSNGFTLDTTDSGTGGDTGVGDSNGFTLDTTDSGTGGDTGHGDSSEFTLDTTDSGTGGDTGHGDSNGFALDTTDSGTGGDTGVGDSNGFALDTTDSGTGGDTGYGDSNGFALDTTDSGTGGDTGHGDSNGFTLDTTDSGTGGDTGHGDSNGFTIDTTDSGTGGDTGYGDSNEFALDTTDSGTGGDTGYGDSNEFALDTSGSGSGGDTGVGDSNGFTLDTTNSGTGGNTGYGDSNGFPLDTEDYNNEPEIISEVNYSNPENRAFVTDIDAYDSDPDQTLTYSISGGQDRFLFIINAITGTLSFSNLPDFENPEDANKDNLYELTVAVSDGVALVESELFIEIVDIWENRPPTGLKLSSNTLFENLQEGSLVGNFYADDPDSNDSFSYFLISGPDDQNETGISKVTHMEENATQGKESLFHLETDGSLTTLRPLDYESDVTYHSILVMAEDSHGGHYQQWFELELLNVVEDIDQDGIEDAFDDDRDGDGFSNDEELVNGTDPDNPYSLTNQPIVSVNDALIDGNDTILLSGDVLFDGDGKILDFGFVLSSRITLDSSISEVYWVRGLGSASGFALDVNEHPFTNIFYYRAWAKNAAGYGISSVKKFIIPEDPQAWWGEITDHEAEWKTSDWFGTFRYYEKGWMFHTELGWLYTSPDQNGGVWLWTTERGWLWTNQALWPYLFQQSSLSWLYYISRENGKGLFYDFSTSSYDLPQEEANPVPDTEENGF